MGDSSLNAYSIVLSPFCAVVTVTATVTDSCVKHAVILVLQCQTRECCYTNMGRQGKSQHSFWHSVISGMLVMSGHNGKRPTAHPCHRRMRWSISAYRKP